jgi:hypothetical protein
MSTADHRIPSEGSGVSVTDTNRLDSPGSAIEALMLANQHRIQAEHELGMLRERLLQLERLLKQPSTANKGRR